MQLLERSLRAPLPVPKLSSPSAGPGRERGPSSAPPLHPSHRALDSAALLNPRRRPRGLLGPRSCRRSLLACAICPRVVAGLRPGGGSVRARPPALRAAKLIRNRAAVSCWRTRFWFCPPPVTVVLQRWALHTTSLTACVQQFFCKRWALSPRTARVPAFIRLAVVYTSLENGTLIQDEMTGPCMALYQASLSG